jgi:hypothetical protein
MRSRWQAFTSKLQRIFRLIVLFCILRFVLGIAMIAIFDRGAIAWGPELTVVIVAALAVYLGVALIVRYASRPA